MAEPAARRAAALTADVFSTPPSVSARVEVLVSEGTADVDGVVYPHAIEMELSLPETWAADVASGAPRSWTGTQHDC